MVFKNNKGYSSRVLRLKDDETIEEGIARLQGDGWIIEDYTESSDAQGKILVPGIKPEKAESTEEDQASSEIGS